MATPAGRTAGNRRVDDGAIPMLYQLPILYAERVKDEDLVEVPRFGCGFSTVRPMDKVTMSHFRRDARAAAPRSWLVLAHVVHHFGIEPPIVACVAPDGSAPSSAGRRYAG